jgi:hypothetical protein
MNVLDKLVRALDLLGKTVEIFLSAIFKMLDYLIKTLEEVSKKILSLITSFLKLLFYVLPFVLMIVIGRLKEWTWMEITGYSVIGLVFILFMRDFISLSRGTQAAQPEKSPYSRRVFLIVLVLNILLVGYSLMYYVAGINSEQYVYNLFQGVRVNTEADAIRETYYIDMLNSTNIDVNVVDAIRSLGELKSENARPILIDKLLTFDLQAVNTTPAHFDQINAIIEALQDIGGASACSSLVKVEIQSSNSEIKSKARKAADEVCGRPLLTSK